MALTAAALHALTQGSDADAWRVIIDHVVEIARKPLAAGNAPSEVVKRDREVGELDLFLSSSGWDLWQAFGNSVERTSDRLLRWFAPCLRFRQPQQAPEQRRWPRAQAASRQHRIGGFAVEGLRSPDQQYTEPDLLAPLARRQAARRLRRRPRAGAIDEGCGRATVRRRLLGLRRASGHRSAAGHHFRPRLRGHRLLSRRGWRRRPIPQADLFQRTQQDGRG